MSKSNPTEAELDVPLTKRLEEVLTHPIESKAALQGRLVCADPTCPCKGQVGMLDQTCHPGGRFNVAYVQSRGALAIWCYECSKLLLMVRVGADA